MKLYQSDFPYNTTFYVGGSDNLNRVAVTWLKQNRATSTHEITDYTDPTLANLDLEVYDPDGNLVGSSKSLKGNVEIVQFIPQVTGYYTIKVLATSIQNDFEYVGIAWW